MMVKCKEWFWTQQNKNMKQYYGLALYRTEQLAAPITQQLGFGCGGEQRQLDLLCHTTSSSDSIKN